MSSSDKQRGVFPGLEFFTTLGDIAKEATQKIKDIDRELGQSTTTQDLEDGTLWDELHLEFNKAYNQSIELKQSLINKQSISNSLEAFNSMINWIKIETNRVKKQLQQFGYKIDENNIDYEYQLPLTPQQQIIYDQQQRQDIKDNNDKQSNNNDQMEIDNYHENEKDAMLQSNHNDNGHNDQKNQNIEDIDTDDNDIDIDIDINSKQNQESDIKSSSNFDSNSHSPQQNKDSNGNLNNKNKESSDTLSLDQEEIKTTNITRKPYHQTIIPPSPVMPVLDDKFKLFFS